MSKFKAGDRFVCTENGLSGLIVSSSWNSNHSWEEYSVTWDAWPYRYSYYEISGVDVLWEHELPSARIVASQIFDSSQAKISVNGHQMGSYGFLEKAPVSEPIHLSDFGEKSISSSCQHVRKTYTGLFEVYDYCDTCGVKL